VTISALPAGTSYNVSEDPVSGYTGSFSADCSGTILPGQTKTCTVTNDDQAAHLIVIGHVVNDNGGTKTAADFALTIGGVTATGGNTLHAAHSPGANKTLTTAGAYSVAGGAVASYSQGRASADCTGTIALGETKSCTITTDDDAPHLIVIK